MIASVTSLSALQVIYTVETNRRPGHSIHGPKVLLYRKFGVLINSLTSAWRMPLTRVAVDHDGVRLP